ncbi:MAG TPA: hypothetical protein VNA20_15055 [Frankiaceae bacterium]|nr:hypothetical protein [Frankiaceae bacterium]
MRYLWHQYGVKQPNVWTNGDQVVDNYNAAYPGFFSVYSHGAGRAPVQGDVLSMSSVSSFRGGDGGHTGVVQSSAVDGAGNGTVTLIEQNGGSSGRTVFTVSAWRIKSRFPYVKWLHRPKNSVAQYAGHIVQWNGDTKAQKTAWYVTPDLKRLWIPDVATFDCLRGRGAPGPLQLGAQTLDALPDQAGKWAGCGNTLHRNRTLRRGMFLRSADSRFELALRGDGNLVLTYAPTMRLLWESGRSADFVVMQQDGNFVAYRNDGVPVWATNTSGSGGDRIALRSSGDLVLYAGSTARWSTNTWWAGEAGHIVQWSGDTKAQKTAWYVTPDLRRLWIPDASTYYCLKNLGAPGPDVLGGSTLDRLPDQHGAWAPCGDTMWTNRALRRGMSLRSADGRYLFTLQFDGNLVLYYLPTGRAVWARNAGTNFVVMQSDGNYVAYVDGGGPVWATNTAGSGAERLVVQSDGNVVIYAGSRAVWASNTVGHT